MKCELIRIGGISDHVHLLATLNPTISIADFVKQVKGSSSHFINHEIRSGFLFKWQGSYGALTVSKSGVDDLCEYIDRQEEQGASHFIIILTDDNICTSQIEGCGDRDYFVLGNFKKWDAPGRTSSAGVFDSRLGADLDRTMRTHD